MNASSNCGTTAMLAGSAAIAPVIVVVAVLANRRALVLAYTTPVPGTLPRKRYRLCVENCGAKRPRKFVSPIKFVLALSTSIVVGFVKSASSKLSLIQYAD